MRMRRASFMSSLACCHGAAFDVSNVPPPGRRARHDVQRWRAALSAADSEARRAMHDDSAYARARRAAV